jgi:RNA polymerase sigma-70 factor (ECF subfamily)
MGESSGVGEALTLFPMGLKRTERAGPASERRTIRAAQRGSEEAIESIVRTYWTEAYATALGMLADRPAAEDVAQEAMLAAIDALDRFDRRRPFRPWLQRIVANRSLDWLRARRRRAEAGLDDATAPSRREPPPADRLSGDLLAALRSLDERSRAIIVLRHLAGFDSKEIAEIVEMSPTAVRSALRRGLERMRRELSDVPISSTAAGEEEAQV